MLGNIMILLVIALAIGAAVWKLMKDKRKGNHCSGCPYSQNCPSEIQSNAKKMYAQIGVHEITDKECIPHPEEGCF